MVTGVAADIRRADVSDAAACAGIVHGWIAGQPWLAVKPELADLVAVFETGIPQREVYVIDAPVAGYLSMDPDAALIHGFYVDRPGGGLGKALLDRAKQGRDYLQLWTHEPNGSAHRFYWREGFETVERKQEGRGDGVPELRMEWRR